MNAIVFVFSVVLVPYFKIVYWFFSGLERLHIFYTAAIVNNLIVFIAIIL